MKAKSILRLFRYSKVPAKRPTRGSCETPEGRNQGAPSNKGRQYGANHHQNAPNEERCAPIERIDATSRVKKGRKVHRR